MDGIKWTTDFKNTTFYSDSINDLPLMEVEKPVAVNPDNQLREIALKIIGK